MTLCKRITEHTGSLPEGTPISAKELLHLGNRGAVDKALSRLATRGELLRICSGEYVRPVKTRFGTRAPSVSRIVAALAHMRGETIVCHGSAAANDLGLTTQVPVRSVYLTSGQPGELRVGSEVVELMHVRNWQLAAPGERAGEAIRAMAYLGPASVHRVMERLSPSEAQKVISLRGTFPQSFAERVSTYSRPSPGVEERQREYV